MIKDFVARARIFIVMNSGAGFFARLLRFSVIAIDYSIFKTAKHPKCHPIRVRFGKPFLPEDREKEGFAIEAKNSYEVISVAAR